MAIHRPHENWLITFGSHLLGFKQIRFPRDRFPSLVLWLERFVEFGESRFIQTLCSGSRTKTCDRERQHDQGKYLIHNYPRFENPMFQFQCSIWHSA